MRATAPSGDASFEGVVQWSGELGYGVRAAEPTQAEPPKTETVDREPISTEPPEPDDGIGTDPEDLLHMKRTADRLLGNTWAVIIGAHPTKGWSQEPHRQRSR